MDQLIHVARKLKHLVYIGIGGIDGLVGRLGQHMQFQVGQLLAKTPDDRRGEYDVANGTEADEEDLFHFIDKDNRNSLVRIQVHLKTEKKKSSNNHNYRFSI